MKFSEEPEEDKNICDGDDNATLSSPVAGAREGLSFKLSKTTAKSLSIENDDGSLTADLKVSYSFILNCA